MANYANLKSTIDANVNTNGTEAITGAVLNSVLKQMVSTMGEAGYLYKGVATPATSPGTPDTNVWYLASAAETYTNFGGAVVADGEVAILKYNGSWTKEVTGAATATQLTQLGQELNLIKANKDIGVNLVNPDTALPGYYINSLGNIVVAQAPVFKVSDYIPVNERDIISNAFFYQPSIAAYNVYDFQKNLLRTEITTRQYTYQSGDYYVRFCFNTETYPMMANYGTTLAAYQPYTETARLDETKSQADLNNDKIFELENDKIDKKPSPNLINPEELESGKAISWSGSINSSVPAEFKLSGYILIDGHDIISNAFCVANTWASMLIYDKDKNLLRTNGANRQYTYQSGDYFVRISFQANAISACLANYGTALNSYTPFYEYKPLYDSEQRLLKELDTKLDKVYGDNLINPENLSRGVFPAETTTGVPVTIYPINYVVSEFLPVNENDIISNGYNNAPSLFAAMCVYDSDKNFLRTVSTRQYTYQQGDSYIRISFDLNDINNFARANYGTVLTTEVYTENKPLTDLKQRVEYLEQEEGAIDFEIPNIPNAIYCTYNAINTRQTISRLYMSHILGSLDLKNKEIYFENYIRNLPIVPQEVETKDELNKTINITPKRGYINKSFNTKYRISRNTVSKSILPRILVIGDSVSNGYGGTSNRVESWLPTRYWAFTKMFFEMDKIDSGDNANEYNALLVGGTLVSGDFTINYGGVSRAIRAKTEAMGGASLEQLYTPTFGAYSDANPFYDSVNQTFSMTAYLTKYRTMDNLGVRLVSTSTNPAGESVVGSDGITYTIGTEINTQAKLADYDICEPTHVVINLNHNTSKSNFETYIGQVVNKIKSELPNAVVIIMIIDETGGYFPCDYPNYPSENITYQSNLYHKKNNEFYNYVLQNVENEANGVFCFGAQFIQPTAESYATIDADFGEYVNKADARKMQIPNPAVLAPTAHPNNFCHSAWGYGLYSMIKWLIS